jgi:hypothetical protein
MFLDTEADANRVDIARSRFFAFFFWLTRTAVAITPATTTPHAMTMPAIAPSESDVALTGAITVSHPDLVCTMRIEIKPGPFCCFTSILLHSPTTRKKF